MESVLNFLIMRLPDSTLGYVGHIGFGLIGGMFFASFFEYFVHRYIMHKGFSLFGGKPVFYAQHHNHAALHHGTFYKQFDHEDDPTGREISIVFTPEEIVAFQLAFLPVEILIAVFSPVVAICFSVMAILHNLLWNTIHRQMHQPAPHAWANWALYRFYARYHFLHHRHTGTNFNVVLPFADFVLGTNANAMPDDLAEMKRLKYL